LRVLITGAAGQLGADLARLLPNAAAKTHAELSIDDAASVRAVFEEVRPELVFNCAAYNAVDRAESEPGAAFAVNAEGPRLLAQVCSESGARLVHFSTNFVFDGRAQGPYVEADSPSPLSAYARSKLAGERAVLETMPGALVVRSSGLFGRSGSAVKGGSFPARILGQAREGQPLRVVEDQRLNPTYTGHLARAVLEYVDRELRGIVHAVADGCCSWLEFAQEVLKVADVEREVAPMRSAELSAPAPRPENGCLASERVSPLASWRSGVRVWFEEISRQ
jgi:dTDP-4-dehydrorhamnose reductase